MCFIAHTSEVDFIFWKNELVIESRVAVIVKCISISPDAVSSNRLRKPKSLETGHPRQGNVCLSTVECVSDHQLGSGKCRPLAFVHSDSPVKYSWRKYEIIDD